MKVILSLAALLTLSISQDITAQTASNKEGYKLVYSQDFESQDVLSEFDMTDSRAWRIGSGDSGKTLELFGESEYRSRVRSPFNIALLKDVVVGDFILEADLAQSGREYGHRDLCLFFNVNSPTNFYYVHIASVADNNANNIFLVNDEPRTNIATKTTNGTNWGATNSWHKVKIERKVEEGTIKIYFDDMDKPIMEATDKHFIDGRIGFGSFDDTGQFDNIKIWAPKLIPAKKGFFK